MEKLKKSVSGYILISSLTFALVSLYFNNQSAFGASGTFDANGDASSLVFRISESANTVNMSSVQKNIVSIETVIKTYETALNANDIDTIMNLYGSEPIFMPQYSPALIGRDAVRAGYEQVFKTIKLNVRFEIHDIQVAGDWAWARTSSSGSTNILANGLEVEEGNNELFVFWQENGDWKVHRYLFSTNRPRA